MKLTKGKLSKLFHKKKQTMRRYKNQRKYRRASKTFRQRKPLNLHRSSMKKLVVPRKIEWIGGTEPDEKVPLVVKPASDEPTISVEPASEPLAEPVAQLASEPVPEPVAEPATKPVPESVPQPVAEQSTEVAPESVAQPVAEEPVPEPVAQQIPEQVSEPVAEQVSQPVSEPTPIPEESVPESDSKPIAEEPTPQPDSKPVVEEPTPEPLAKSVEEPIVAENVKQESSPVADALNLIADKIATAVVNKMRENPATSSSPNQDADIAVPLAVNAVVKQTQLAPE